MSASHLQQFPGRAPPQDQEPQLPGATAGTGPPLGPPHGWVPGCGLRSRVVLLWTALTPRQGWLQTLGPAQGLSGCPQVLMGLGRLPATPADLCPDHRPALASRVLQVAACRWSLQVGWSKLGHQEGVDESGWNWTLGTGVGGAKGSAFTGALASGPASTPATGTLWGSLSVTAALPWPPWSPPSTCEERSSSTGTERATLGCVGALALGQPSLPFQGLSALGGSKA